ncbi:hypothetical protein GCM10010094_77750 [Streptomyces flaveus]|uniref:HTH cro/C1-type domain-containing protein n=1 Tax=Streptomyces flaveus TaxID=66370 RepID=A0A917RFD7_9ACTN|nr:hypothetical protein GCM10010094_77750 [Streptomyces flaveus]
MAEAQSEARRIGEVIRQARVFQRRSQADVAAALGYHQSKVSRLEGGRGTEDIRVLRAVAQELNIPPHQFGLATAPDVSAADLETEDMHRRTFLAASIAALAVPATPPRRTTTWSGPSCPDRARPPRAGRWAPQICASASPRHAGSSTPVTTPNWSALCRA